MASAFVTTIKLKRTTKLAAQLLARSCGMTFASLVESLIDAHLAVATIDGRPALAVLEALWHRDPAVRLALMGSQLPEALTERERLLWEGLVCREQSYWLVPLGDTPPPVNEQTFNFDVLRERLPMLASLSRDRVSTIDTAMRKVKRITT